MIKLVSVFGAPQIHLKNAKALSNNAPEIIAWVIILDFCSGWSHRVSHTAVLVGYARGASQRQRL